MRIPIEGQTFSSYFIAKKKFLRRLGNGSDENIRDHLDADVSSPSRTSYAISVIDASDEG